MKVYYPNGEEIKSFEEFIKFYNRCYYWKNNYNVEKYFDKLIKEGIKEKTDIFKILAWKIGKIKQKESTADKFVYSKDWDGENNFRVKLSNENVDLSEFISFIWDNMSDLKEMNPTQMITTLKNKQIIPKGIGTVYLVTLCYFITQSKYPIFDRFADIALKAIIKGKKVRTTIKHIELPEKNYKNFEELIEKEYSDFTKRIKQVEDDFYVKYKDSRDIDRALWAYGHLF